MYPPVFCGGTNGHILTKTVGYVSSFPQRPSIHPNSLDLGCAPRLSACCFDSQGAPVVAVRQRFTLNCAFFFWSDSSATMHLIKALLVLAEHTLSSAVCGSAVAWHRTELGGILLEQLQLLDHEESILLQPRAIRDGRLLASTSWVATWEVLLCCVGGRSVQTCFGLLGDESFLPTKNISDWLEASEPLRSFSLCLRWRGLGRWPTYRW